MSPNGALARHGSAPNPRFHPPMRTDLLFAAVLGTVSVFLALAGFFVLDWSPPVLGVLLAVFVVADGYLVFGLVQQAKKPPVP